MRRFCTYTRLCFKRMLRYAPFVFVVTLLLCFCLAIALLNITKINSSDDDQKKIKIGFVGDFENSFVDFGITAIKTFDTSRYFLEIEDLDEPDARESLINGDISAYVVIHQEFVDNALDGKIGKVRFVTREANADVVNLFKEEVLKLISCILVESQNGTYAMQNLLRENGCSMSQIHEMTDELAIEYIGMIVNRANALEIEIIGVSENLTFSGYMFSGITVLMILLAGIVCAPLFIRRDYALPKLMCANRYGPYTQTSGEYLSFFAVMGLVAAGLSFIMMMYAGRMADIIPELEAVTVSEILLIIIKFIPAIVLITSLQYMLYQLSGSVISGVLIQFVSSVLLGYLSGCFYPISFFPKVIRIVSDVLPSGMSRAYFSSLLTNTASPWSALAILLYSIVLLALSGYIRQCRIKKA